MSFAERDIKILKNAVDTSLSPELRAALGVHVVGEAPAGAFGFGHEESLDGYHDAIVVADCTADELRTLHAKLVQGGLLFAVTDPDVLLPDGGEHWIVDVDRIDNGRRVLIIRYE